MYFGAIYKIFLQFFGNKNIHKFKLSAKWFESNTNNYQTMLKLNYLQCFLKQFVESHVTHFRNLGADVYLEL